MALDAASPGLGLCLLFPCCCLSTSHTCSVAVRRTDVLGVGEHGCVSLCTVLFPDTVQNISGLDFPFTGLSDSTRELQSMKCGLRAECTVLFPPVVRQPKTCNLGKKHVLLPFSGQDSLLEGCDAGRAPGLCEHQLHLCHIWHVSLWTCLFRNVM